MPKATHILGLADTGTAEVTDLIPVDVYSAKVLEALYAARKLAGIVTAVREDLSAKEGAIVQVPYISKRTAQGPITEGNALTATASATGTYPITLSKYGDYDRVNKEVFEDQSIFTQQDFINNIGGALAEKVDALIYAALIAATAGSTSDLTTAGTLTDLYDKIVDCKGKMKKLNEAPDFVILGPDQEAQLLKDTSEGIKFESIKVSGGELLQVAGLNVIVTSHANANAATLDMVQAVLVYSRRAIGEAWGRRPETLVDPVTDAPSDKVRLITWMRYGTAVMELNAIGFVTNPSA